MTAMLDRFVAYVFDDLHLEPEHLAWVRSAVKFQKIKGKLHAELNLVGVASAEDGTVAARFSDTVNLDFDSTSRPAGISSRWLSTRVKTTSAKSACRS